MSNQLKNRWISLVVAILLGIPYGFPIPLAFADDEPTSPLSQPSPTGVTIPTVPVAQAISRGVQGARIARPGGYTEPGIRVVPCPPGSPAGIACAVAAAEVSREPSVPTESDSPLSRVELPVLVGRSNTGAWAYEEVGDNPPFRGAKIIGCDGSKGTCSAVSAAGVEETPNVEAAAVSLEEPTPPTPAATLSAQVVQTPSQPAADEIPEMNPVPTDVIPSRVDTETEPSGVTITGTVQEIPSEREPIALPEPEIGKEPTEPVSPEPSETKEAERIPFGTPLAETEAPAAIIESEIEKSPQAGASLVVEAAPVPAPGQPEPIETRSSQETRAVAAAVAAKVEVETEAKPIAPTVGGIKKEEPASYYLNVIPLPDAPVVKSDKEEEKYLRKRSRRYFHR